MGALVGDGGIGGGAGGSAGVGLQIEAAGVTEGIFTATGGSNSFLGLGFFGGGGINGFSRLNHARCMARLFFVVVDI
jgi:hypothetical protein